MQSSGNCEAGKVRAFVGLKVAGGSWLQPLTDALAGNEFPGFESLRLSPDRNLHITLKFLGSVSETAIPELSIHLAQVCAKHQDFGFSCKGLGYFKHAIWLGIEACPALEALASDVETCCSLLGYPADSKAYKPHVTIARFGKAAKQPLLQLMESFAGKTWFDDTASEACLFKSETLPSGAVYSVMERYPLRSS